MLILTVRTYKPEAEVGLFQDNTQLEYEVWSGHKQLAETIHQKIHKLLQAQKKDWHDIDGIVCFKGPGSFTGLRIGLTVANTLAHELSIPIIGATGEDWRSEAVAKLLSGKTETIVLPEYGRDAHITTPRK
jgi:tRNA threonylcarbamoyladenosine biosynthesis protein TsaB